MTILTAYAPNELDLTSDRVYKFDFPAADDRSVEVYEIIDVDGDELRYLVPVQDYTLTWNSPNPRYPLKRNGKVTFNRRHSVDTLRVSIERNTLIAQLIDFPKYQPFKTRMVEFAFDKATMIFQEIAERKCNASTTTPITQEITFGSYEDIRANELNFAVQKLFDIAQEIKDSADDCVEVP